MPGRTSIRPSKKSDQRTTEQLPIKEIAAGEMTRSTSTGAVSVSVTSSGSDLFREVTAGEMTRSTSTGEISAMSFESDLLQWNSSSPPVAWINSTNVGQITQSLNVGVEPSSTVGRTHNWRCPYLLDIFTSCCNRWCSHRD